MQTSYNYVIVGAGVTAANAAEAIRNRDADGTIAVFGEEPHPPYDRPPLSKDFLAGDDLTADDIQTKPHDFYGSHRVELHSRCRVAAIDRPARQITLDTGKKVQYGKLLLATGSSAAVPDIPGIDKKGVLLLRRVEDAENLRDAIRAARHAVIIGGGFLGMEAASCALARGIDTTVIEPGPRLWGHFASPRVADFIRREYEKRGLQCVLGQAVSTVEAEQGYARFVRVADGTAYPADFVLAATGARLNTQLASDAGLNVDPKQGVMVNQYLATSDPFIWAAGDIACFHDLVQQREWHVEHYMNAMGQGEAVGAIMTGEHKPFDQVAYFFTDVLDLHLVLRGDPDGRKDSLFSGDVEGGEFLEFSHDEAGLLRAAVAVSRDQKRAEDLADLLEKPVRARVNVVERRAEIEAEGFDVRQL